MGGGIGHVLGRLSQWPRHRIRDPGQATSLAGCKRLWGFVQSVAGPRRWYRALLSAGTWKGTATVGSASYGWLLLSRLVLREFGSAVLLPRSGPEVYRRSVPAAAKLVSVCSCWYGGRRRCCRETVGAVSSSYYYDIDTPRSSLVLPRVGRCFAGCERLR